MQEITFSPSTVVFLVIILIGVFFAVRRLVTHGTCDCHDHCGDSCPSKRGNMGIIGADGSTSASSGCSHCGAVANMVANMEKSAEQTKAPKE
jgi:hypothetical protein